MRIEGGTSARIAEGEVRCAAPRPYGVSMRAATGKPFTLADMERLDAFPQRQQEQPDRSTNRQNFSASEDGANDRVQTTSFRPVTAQNLCSSPAACTSPIEAISPHVSKETPTLPRSPFQTLRSLFSRMPGMKSHDEK
jgi:hypothetical protein